MKELEKNIERLKQVFEEIQILIPQNTCLYDDVKEILDFARSYFKDCLYFYSNGKLLEAFELANYIWGVLETLVKLGFVKVDKTIKYFKVDQP